MEFQVYSTMASYKNEVISSHDLSYRLSGEVLKLMLPSSVSPSAHHFQDFLLQNHSNNRIQISYGVFMGRVVKKKVKMV